MRQSCGVRSYCVVIEDPVDRACDVKSSIKDAARSREDVLVSKSCETVIRTPVLLSRLPSTRDARACAKEALGSGGSKGDAGCGGGASLCDGSNPRCNRDLSVLLGLRRAAEEMCWFCWYHRGWQSTFSPLLRVQDCGGTSWQGSLTDDRVQVQMQGFWKPIMSLRLQIRSSVN